MKFFRTLFLALTLFMSGFIFGTAVTYAEQPVCGSWCGSLNVTPQMKLKLVLNFLEKDGVWNVTFDSPDQNAYDIPCKVNFLSADSVNVSVAGIGANYAARLEDGVLHGTFRQGFAQLPLDMSPGKGKEEPKRTQMPAPPFPYTTQEVCFTSNPYDSYALTGTLTLPEKYNLETPVVVMVTGSGIQNRDEEVMGHRPFAVIADYLARHGIASLRYDDRGYGADTPMSGLTTETFARDAWGAVNFLKSRKFENIGMLGHSEGGEIAFMLASRKDGPKFIVTIGAPAVRGDSLLVDQNKALLEATGTPQTVTDNYAKALEELYAAKIAGNKAIDVDAITAAWASTPVYIQLRENLRKIASDRNEWLEYFISYSPAQAIASINIPALALYGEKDMQVRPGLNAEKVRSLNPNVDVRVYPSLNHLMQHAVTGLPAEYTTIEETFSPEVLADIASFINSL